MHILTVYNFQVSVNQQLYGQVRWWRMWGLCDGALWNFTKPSLTVDGNKYAFIHQLLYILQSKIAVLRLQLILMIKDDTVLKFLTVLIFLIMINSLTH